MANIKLDFSKMEHIKSDKDKTMLRHKIDGHEITLQHKSLSPENQTRLMALAGISKSAATPLEADQMAHRMCEGGPAKMANGGDTEHVQNVQKYGVDQANQMQAAQLSSEAAAPVSAVNRDAAIAQQQQAIRQQYAAREAARQASAPQAPTPEDQGYRQMNAQGGEQKKPENKIDYSQFVSEKRPLPRGPSTELNYKEIKKDYKEKNRQAMYEGGTPTHNNPATISGQAEGGTIQNPGEPNHPGAKCPMCGGGTAKMYADPNQQVSSDDNAPMMSQMPQDNALQQLVPAGMTSNMPAPTYTPTPAERAGEIATKVIRHTPIGYAYNTAKSAYDTAKEVAPAVKQGAAEFLQGAGKEAGFIPATEREIASQQPAQAAPGAYTPGEQVMQMNPLPSDAELAQQGQQNQQQNANTQNQAVIADAKAAGQTDLKKVLPNLVTPDTADPVSNISAGIQNQIQGQVANAQAQGNYGANVAKAAEMRQAK